MLLIHETRTLRMVSSLISQVSPLETVENLEDTVLSHIFGMSPRYAVFLGLHDYDGLLPDYSVSNLKSWVEKAQELKNRLGRIETLSRGSRRKLDRLCMELLL